MPHIIIHHSDALDVSGLMSDLHVALGRQPTIDPDAVKTRALSFSGAHVGQNNYLFVHLEVRLLRGRTLDLLQSIKKALVRIAQPHIPLLCVLTLEIIEMNPDLYDKGDSL